MSVKDLHNYIELREKQRLANKYMKDAKERLGENNRYFNSAVNRITMFQKKAGKTPSMRLTMTKLTDENSDKYERLLDSIIDSTYINPEKYELHKQRQLDFAINEGWASNREEAEQIYDFANSELVAELKDMGLGDIPSELVEKYAKYTQSNMTEEDFTDMAKMFMKSYSSGEVSKEQFYDFVDTYAKYNKDFSRILNAEFASGIESNMTFVDAYKLGIYNMPDVEKATSEYIGALQLDDDGTPLSFIEYLTKFYI